MKKEYAKGYLAGRRIGTKDIDTYMQAHSVAPDIKVINDRLDRMERQLGKTCSAIDNEIRRAPPESNPIQKECITVMRFLAYTRVAKQFEKDNPEK